MDWTPERIEALRKHIGVNQREFGITLGYGEAGAQSRVSDLENGKGGASGAVQKLLDILAREHNFQPETRNAAK